MATLKRGWRNAFRHGRSGSGSIEVGRRFVSTEYRHLVWEVVSVSSDYDDDIPHVRLARVGAPYDTKTISASVLGDKRFFQLADEA